MVKNLLFNVLFRDDVNMLENISRELKDKITALKAHRGIMYKNLCRALEEIILPIGADDPVSISEWYNLNTLYSATYCFIAKSMLDAYQYGYGCVALPPHEKLEEIVDTLSKELGVIFAKKTKDEWELLKKERDVEAGSYNLGGTTADSFQIFEVSKYLPELS
jgi:hypothetical protein